LTKRYHDGFPQAPQALVSGLSASCLIPSIVGARVGRDGSAYLDIFQNDDFQVDLSHLNDIAEFFQVEEDEVQIENGPTADTVTVTVCSSGFDFSAQFKERDENLACDIAALCKALEGSEDSEESIEAHASTINR
jgi:hypothetical protein